MFNVEKANKIFRKRLKEDPDYAVELIEEWAERMPVEYYIKIMEDEYGCHIRDVDFYDLAVSYLAWTDDKGEGAHWSIEDVEKVADIDFTKKKYTLYDFAYTMNMLYSDYCNVFTDASYYRKMAMNYLEDPDYMGEPDERAYKDALKRIKYYN